MWHVISGPSSQASPSEPTKNECVNTKGDKEYEVHIITKQRKWLLSTTLVPVSHRQQWTVTPTQSRLGPRQTSRVIAHNVGRRMIGSW